MRLQTKRKNSKLINPNCTSRTFYMAVDAPMIRVYAYSLWSNYKAHILRCLFFLN